MSDQKKKLAQFIKRAATKAVKKEISKIKREVIQEVRKEIKNDFHEDETLNNVLRQQQTRDNARAIVSNGAGGQQPQDPQVAAHGPGAVDPKEGQNFSGPEDVQKRLSEAQSNFRNRVQNTQSQAQQMVHQQTMPQQYQQPMQQPMAQQQMPNAQGPGMNQAPRAVNNQIHDPSELSDRAREMIQNEGGPAPSGSMNMPSQPGVNQGAGQAPAAGGFNQQLQQVTGNNPAEVANASKNKGDGGWRPGQ